MSIIGFEARAQRPPQPEEILKDVPLELFGGLCSEMDPGDLPQGASPFCQDVDFFLGGVRTRDGLIARFAGQLPAGAGVNYMKTFTLPTGAKQLLVLDSYGNFYYEDTSNNPGTLNLVWTVGGNTFARSVTFLGREYIAFHNRTVGSFPPMQWDGTNLDRVTQDGPGAPPTVVGVNSSIAIASITQNAAVSLVNGALLWSDAPGSRNHGNVITIYYEQVSAGEPDPNIVVGANVWLQNLPTFSGGLDPNGLYPIAQVLQIIGEDHPGGSNVLWYAFTVIAAASTYQDTFLASGTYQLTAATVTLASPSAQTQAGGTLNITGATPSTWNEAWTVDLVPVTTSATVTNTGLASGTATIEYALQTNPATNTLYPHPTAGQLVTIVGSDNGGGIFNVINAPIVTVTPAGTTGTLTVQLNSADVAAAPDTGTMTVQGTEFMIDPAELSPVPDNPIFGDDTGTGDAAVAGNLPAGTYKCVLMFQTRNGALGRCSPPVTFTLSGTETALTASQIATGPVGQVVARWLAFTGPNGGFYYVLPIPVSTTTAGVTTNSSATVINDNLTTSVTLSFTIDALLAGQEVDQPGGDQFALDVLGPVLAFDEYADRLLSWGELEAQQNFLNMGFDGGFAPASAGGANPNFVHNTLHSGVGLKKGL